MTAALWLAVLVGALGGVTALMRPTAPAPSPAATLRPADRLIPSPTVTGVAEWAARTSLTAATDDSARVAIGSPSSRQPSDTRVTVESATAIHTAPVADSYWAVTVAALVTIDPSLPKVTWFLEIGVVDTANGPVVAADPALVSGPPSTGGRVDLAGTMRVPDRSDPVVETVVTFLTALLSGDPSVSRWTAPGLDTAAAVGDGTFETIRVERVSSDAVDDITRRSLAAVTATTPSGATVVLTYEVTAVARGNRWEISSVGAPTFSSIDEAAPATPPPPTTPAQPATPTTAQQANPQVESDDGSSANPYLFEEEEN